VLRRELGDDDAKVPTRGVPNLLVRAMALFDPGIRSITNQLGYSSEKAKTELGWSPRPLDEKLGRGGGSSHYRPDSRADHKLDPFQRLSTRRKSPLEPAVEDRVLG
jgi:hypothetical protein